MCTLDGIIDTISAMHPLTPLIDLLKSHGKLVMVGAPEKPLELLLPSLIMGMYAKIFSLIYVQVITHLKVEFTWIEQPSTRIILSQFPDKERDILS